MAKSPAWQRKEDKNPNGGLYANINAKKKRIANEKATGKPVEHMRKVGSKGAPTKDDFIQSVKTAKMKTGGSSKKTCW